MSETLNPLQLKKLDTLILGCTHYPLLRPLIQNIMGNHVKLIDSGAETVSEVSMLLDYFDIANTPEYKNEANQFYTTGSAKMFKAIANDWLDLETVTVEQTRLSNISGGYKHDQT